ncbi:MAG: gliding motility-associated C-terminal domain-containing protein [Bacteroidota bacterium]
MRLHNYVLRASVILLLILLFGISISPAQSLSDCANAYTFQQNTVNDGAGNNVSMVIIEFEDIPNRDNLGEWEFRTTNLNQTNGAPFPSSFSGDGYLYYTGPNLFQDGGNAIIEYNIEITDPGKYRFIYASAIGTGNNGTEHNDAWVKFPDADAFYAYRASSNSIAVPNDQGVNRDNPDPNNPILKAAYPGATYKVPEGADIRNNGFFKIFMNQLNDWWYEGATSDNEGYPVYVRFENPGVYTMQISGRSNGFAIDRAILWKEEGNFDGLNNRNNRRNAFSGLSSNAPSCNNAPFDLVGTKRSATEIDLSWKDNAATETGFEIQVSDSEAFTNVLSTTNTGANVVETTINGLNEGSTYFFRVRANLPTSNTAFTEAIRVTTNIKPTLTGNLTYDVVGAEYIVFPASDFQGIFSDVDGESGQSINILSLPQGIRDFEMGFRYDITAPREIAMADLTNFEGDPVFRYRANNNFTGTTSFTFTISDGFDFAETTHTVTINVLKPQFQISYKGSPLTDRGDFNIGEVPVDASLPLTFVIENIGSAPLNLTNLPLQITNSAIDHYRIVQQPDRAVLAPGETTDLIVAFEPTTTGNKNNAQIVINNDDFNSNDRDFRVDLFGRGVNDDTPPTFLSDTTVSIPENNADAYVAQADEWVYFTMATGKDEALFEINSLDADTVQTLRFISPPDFENPGDSDNDNVYLVDLIATDLSGFTTLLSVSIRVTDIVNEAKPIITSATNVSVVENTAGAFYTATADKAVTFSLGSSQDEALFSLQGDQISFVNPPDFEIPLDGNADNVYLIDLTASEVAGDTTVTLSISVTDLDETGGPTGGGEKVTVEARNLVTPNGDGRNDEWLIEPFAGMEASAFKVFDKNGNVIFSSQGYATPWDGTFDGSALAEGVYFYQIEGPNVEKSGYVFIKY